jgi:hypothetical protein
MQCRDGRFKDQNLPDDVEENRDGDQIPDRRKCNAQQFAAARSVKRERPQKRRDPLPRIFDSTPRSQDDGHGWLHDEA